MIIIPFTENNWNLFDFRPDPVPDPDPDPLFPEADPHQNEADPKHCFFVAIFIHYIFFNFLPFLLSLNS